MPAPPAGAETARHPCSLNGSTETWTTRQTEAGEGDQSGDALNWVSSEPEEDRPKDRYVASQRYPPGGEPSAPAGGAGIEPGISTPGSGPPPPHQKPRRGAGSSIRTVACLRPFGASGNWWAPFLGLKPQALCLRPLRGLNGKTSVLLARPSPQQIPLVVRNPILLEQRDQLVLEGHLFVVLLLIADVASDLVHERLAHGKNAVPHLPLESLHAAWPLVDPSRGVSLDLLDHHGDRDVRLEFGEEVDVVGHPADLQQDAALSPDDAAYVFVERLSEVAVNQRDTVFGRIDDVIEQVGESCGHKCPLPRRRRLAASVAV